MSQRDAEVITNVPNFDWLTLTTFAQKNYVKWLSMVEKGVDRGHESIPGQVMQYRGIHVGNVFIGQGMQKRRQHYYFRVSGSPSNYWAMATRGSGGATRLDYQITVETDPFDWADWARMLKESDWKGRKLNVDQIVKEDGYNTIYLGSRRSRSFVRVYVKSVSPYLVRFELEAKRDLAAQLWQSWTTDVNRPRRVLMGMVDRVPCWVSALGGQLKDRLATEGEAVPVRLDDGDPMHWLRNTVSPYVKRMMATHESGLEVCRMVREWAEEADQIDSFDGFEDCM